MEQKKKKKKSTHPQMKSTFSFLNDNFIKNVHKLLKKFKP